MEETNVTEWNEERKACELDMTEITLRGDGKMNCKYKKDDAIYNLTKETTDMPTKEEINKIATCA